MRENFLKWLGAGSEIERKKEKCVKKVKLGGVSWWVGVGVVGAWGKVLGEIGGVMWGCWGLMR